MTEQPLQGERTDYRKLTEWKRAPINVSNSEYADSLDYGQGYADGKEKAHFEIREMTVDHDWKRCGCEPCITVRAIAARIGRGVEP